MTFVSRAARAMTLIVLTQSMALVSSMAYAADLNVTLTPTNFSFFSVNTTNTSTAPARNVAVIGANPGVMTGVCQGIWVDTELNKSAYAMLLSAVTAQRNIVVYYDPAQPSPWGVAAWCALTGVIVVP